MNPMDASDQAEIARLRSEIAQLQEQLKARQASVPAQSSTASLINDHGFVADMARFADKILSEAEIRKKYYLSDEDWERAGSDDALVRAIQDEKTRRVRSGLHAKEKAQKVFIKAPDVLDEILSDKNASPRHRIESSRELRAIAAVSPEHTPAAERFVININLGAGEVLRFNKPIAPGIDDDGNLIEQKPLPMIEEDDSANSV
jgi:hypothetical protein